jgi:predicted transposase/invertase (TIGR01784 family)
MIGILDFSLPDNEQDENNPFTRVYLTDEATRKRFSDKLDLIFIELPKFGKTSDELVTNADRWLFCLKNLQHLHRRPAEVQGRVFEKLFKLLQIKRLNPEEMKTYNESITQYSDVRSAMNCARKEGIMEGMQRGLLEGEQRGMQRGLLEGEQRGIQFLIYNMSDRGSNPVQIANLTGLAEEEIRKMLKDK